MNTIDFIVLHKDNTTETHKVSVYLDDTIENVKTKVSENLDVKNIQHYYLFYKKKIQYNPYDIYKQLSLDGTKTITDKIFNIFCLNHNLPLTEEKEIYVLNDFLKLDLKEIETSYSIGISRKSNFVINPFQNKYNQLEDSSTLSKELLMTYDIGNEIYLCLASEVFEYCSENGLENKQVINVYYPYLFQHKQFELGMLNSNESSVEKYKEYNG